MGLNIHLVHPVTTAVPVWGQPIKFLPGMEFGAQNGTEVLKTFVKSLFWMRHGARQAGKELQEMAGRMLLLACRQSMSLIHTTSSMEAESSLLL